MRKTLHSPRPAWNRVFPYIFIISQTLSLFCSGGEKPVQDCCTRPDEQSGDDERPDPVKKNQVNLKVLIILSASFEYSG